MYICLCHGITEKQIREAVRTGVRSLPELSACLGVATCCGTCSCAAEDVIQSACEAHTLREAATTH